MDIIEQVKEKAKKCSEGANSCHDWAHTERVYNLCMHIGEKENADIEILKLAALLHDVSRLDEDKVNGKICHATEGGVRARKILEDLGVEKEKIDKIVHCIETHRFRNEKVPESKEAKILFDSDKLDAIGAVGIGRAFMFAQDIGGKLHNHDVDIEKTEQYSRDDTAYREFTVKLRKIKDKMLTEEGKRLAEGRHSMMVEFFDRINKEVDGEL